MATTDKAKIVIDGVAYNLVKVTSSIRKQMPQKPTKVKGRIFYLCPHCRLAIKEHIEKSTKKINNCPFCGQALDWSE